MTFHPPRHYDRVDPSIEKSVSQWFAQHNGASLMLPSGWFGRPGDNLHQLTCILTRPYKLILELDQQVLLVFTGVRKAHVEMANQSEEHFVLQEFDRLVFDRLAYGSMEPDTQLFDEGEVRFVRHVLPEEFRH